eukprot:6279034-Amphidinium_carterae.1
MLTSPKHTCINPQRPQYKLNEKCKTCGPAKNAARVKQKPEKARMTTMSRSLARPSVAIRLSLHCLSNGNAWNLLNP